MFNTLNQQQRNSLVGGAALILIGLLVFVAQFTHSESLGWLITGTLAIIFLIWGIVTRQSGFFIPAGILGGVAVGIFLTMSSIGLMPEERSGALMICSLAVGFAIIPILSRLFTNVTHWWALIVAAILGFVGVALWLGALGLLTFVGQAWPLILVIIGLGIMWRVWRNKAV